MPKENQPTAEDVARMMMEEIEKAGELGQEEATMLIREQYGEHFLHETDYGNYGINQDVLNAFKRLRGDRVKWYGSQKLWSWSY
jgi:hypothetical protein